MTTNAVSTDTGLDALLPCCTCRVLRPIATSSGTGPERPSLAQRTSSAAPNLSALKHEPIERSGVVLSRQPAAGDRDAARRQLHGHRQGLRRQGAGAIAAGTAPGADGARRAVRDLGRRADPDGPARRALRPRAALRHHLVHRRDRQIPPAARRGAGRLVLPAALCAGLAAVLPGRDRQGAGASLAVARSTCWSSASSSISLFETVLGILRTYLFAHTTNRIDVELGARLFRHLLALPMAYFQARRVGDSVARVRELENIRNFLTSSALTLRDRPVLHLGLPGGDVRLFAAADLHRARHRSRSTSRSRPVATPLFRRRLDEKFRRGAENQAFLVESVTGIETLKAMAVEPQMQRRWEEQLAGYVAASFRVAQPRQHRKPGRAARQQARDRRASCISAPGW